MKNFNYEKAWIQIAKPAFLNLNDKQKQLFHKLLPLIGDLKQGNNLLIPLNDNIISLFDGLTCKEIAELSYASYFVGHWKPGNCDQLFDNTKGESWKVSNVCDQILKKDYSRRAL